MPFHWILEWNGSFFERTTLRDLGCEIHLEHSGKECPQLAIRKAWEAEEKELDASEVSVAMDLTVMHTNGIHERKINYCSCIGHDERHIQLIKYGIFPSSRKAPRLGLTTAALKDFEAHNCASKESALDYMDVARRKNNNGEAHDAP